MKTEDWQQIEDVFHTALSLKDEERAAYLSDACADSESLRAEVESLIAAFESRGGFLEESTLSLGMQVLSGEKSGESLTGKVIGSFRIIRMLGEGGMGKVYLAEDVHLGRYVALKFLSSEFVDDKWARRQLMKEAQAAAMLDHPNICAVHGFGEEDDFSFIVMQYVEGKTLDCLTRERRLELDEALSLSVQIVSALAEAHAHGIIHRDIKPQNIMVTAGGQVKVLDFGLAKVVQQSMKQIGDHLSQTSLRGVIIGTVAYMSPEQLRAERLDYRSDVFSFGTVLYEMLSGSNPYARGSGAETISAILSDPPPPLKDAGADAAQQLECISRKCLEKEKERRYHSASELLYELSSLRERAEDDPRRRHPFPVRWVAALVLLVLLAAASAYVHSRLTRVQNLAILPIINKSDNPDIEYLGDGLTESLINKLSRLSKLRVKAFTVVAGYKGQEVDPQEIGRGLGVDAVLTGTIIRQGESFVLQTNLVDAANGSQLWGERYNVKLERIFELQEEVSEKVSSSLEVWLGGEEKKILAARRTENPEAFRQYMLGRYYWKRRDAGNVERSVAHYNKSIEIDPVYAPAYAGLADCYVLLSSVAYGQTPTREAMAKARAAAKQALEIDDTLAEAHTSLGIIKLRYEWNWEEAEREFKRAIELDPEYAPAHYWYSHLLIVTGRPDESVAESERAKELDPFSPPASMNFCRAIFLARQYDRAAACFDEMLEKNPDNTGAQYVLGYVYMQKRMYEEAIGIFQKLYATNKSLAIAPLGYAYGRVGRRDEALKILDEMEEMSRQTYLPPLERAVVYVGLGDKDEAFAWLEKAYEERSASLTYLTAEPLYDSLRSDARFADLARRLNLTLRPPA